MFKNIDVGQSRFGKLKNITPLWLCTFKNQVIQLLKKFSFTNKLWNSEYFHVPDFKNPSLNYILS